MGKKSSTGAKQVKTSRKISKKKLQVSASRPFPVVGIGASAGGLEASSELLQHLAPNLGMAYVFIHHLSPTFESQLTEILQRKTAMPVHKVKNGMKIEPDHVYVIPPGAFISILDGHLGMRRRKKTDVHPIDYFLNGLAGFYRHKAIGIVLSGTASDGTAGLKSIKLEGGITFAQDESARHRDMPVNAQQSGYVDYVLPPFRIADELSLLVRHPFTVTTANDELLKNEQAIKKILSVVFEKYGVDFFSHYKRTTVNRRIMRRMALNKIDTYEQYTRKLKKDNTEVSALYNDFLINVTSFFREPSFYKAIGDTIMPQLVRYRKRMDPIRIWIPGCASGEEAYSTAICITEFLEQKKLTAPVLIFSTDLDETAIERARQGIYSKTAVQQLSAQRLKKFFTRNDGQFQIDKSIREMCIFSVHNLMKDPPFSRIDLVSCQNVLIYIEAAPQRKILQSIHYALKPTGFLLLGKSESIANATELFQPVESDIRLYRKKNLSVLPRLDVAVQPHVTSPAAHRLFAHRTETDVEKEFDKLLLSRYVPASVLVNKDLEILRFRGSTAPYLEPASGKASLNLLKMLKEDLVFELRHLFQKAKRTNLPLEKKDIPLPSAGHAVSVEITPLKSGDETYYLIVFTARVYEEREARSHAKKTTKGTRPASTSTLEGALKDARKQLRALTDDFDVSREELQSANEEILSANEELQSINEELETSKEELQSSNEELTTINEELQMRIEELRQSRDYVQAIIETMHGPLLVVDGELRVRTANKAFYDFFGLSRNDTEGRFIHELGNRLWDIPALRRHLQEVFPGVGEFKDFEINHNFPVIGNRTMIVNAHRLAYGEAAKEIHILLVFQDITKFRQTEQDLFLSQEQLHLELEGSLVGTWLWNIKTNEIKGSREQGIILGLKDGAYLENFNDWKKMLHPDDRPTVMQHIEKSVSKRTPLDIEFRILRLDGRERWILSKGNTYYDKGGNPEKMICVNIDVTERKRAVEALEESERRFHTLSDNAPVMIWMSDKNQQSVFLNKTWLSFTGHTIEEEMGSGWYTGIHPEDREKFFEIYRAAYVERKEFKADYRFKRSDDEYRWVMAHGVPRYINEDTFVGYIGTCIDITERINLEKQKDDFMGIASHELKTPITSIKAYTQILQDKFQKMDDEGSVNMLGKLDNQIDKLTDLINILLDVARIQSGQMEYKQALFDINTLITEIAEEMQRSYPQHTIKVQLDKDREVFADRPRIAQVLANLISNAVKYSPDANKLIIETYRKNGDLVLTVQDFGIGIPPDKQEQVFERFFRVSEAAGNRVSGLGLGLYISSQIILQQGGRIWLQSEPGKGSKFSFSLPYKANRKDRDSLF